MRSRDLRQLSKLFKQCSGCHQEKPLIEFASNSKTDPKVRYSRCKACKRENEKRRLQDPEVKKKHYETCRKTRSTSKRKRRKAYRDHGLTDKGYNALLRQQQGVCAICRQKEKLCVDHDHSCCDDSYSCGRCVRGLLCNRCNKALGLFRDDIQIVAQATKYLQETKLRPSMPRSMPSYEADFKEVLKSLNNGSVIGCLIRT